jgi:hypothetical protein
MTKCDERDQVYQWLLQDADAYRDKYHMMMELITEMCGQIHYQSHLKHEVKWAKHCISLGLYKNEYKNEEE